MQNLAVILSKPQLGENIGAAARVMSNFGVNDLRIVEPRNGWPNPKAQEMAAHGAQVLEGAKLYATTEEAIADLNFVFATSARTRDMVKPALSPREAALEAAEIQAAGGRVGVLFGCERTGLSNDEVSFAHRIVAVDTNSTNPSLNLAQAVAIITYEMTNAAVRTIGEKSYKLASQAELNGFFTHMEELLDKANFYSVPEKKPRMQHNIRSIFLRSPLTSQEVRTLRGILTAVERGRK
jgi:tRNA/rRNA methyltransferase